MKLNNTISIMKIFIFIIISTFTSSLFAFENTNLLEKIYTNKVTEYIKKNIDAYLSLSGGYSRLQNAKDSTGQAGLIRLGIGSVMNYNKQLQLGSELGFQTGTQMTLPNSSTPTLNPEGIPITLNESPPIDLLLLARYYAYKAFFIQAKGGYAHQNVSLSGADVTTDYIWLPEAQIGVGINFTPKNRISISYQRFFGKKPILTNLTSEDNGELFMKHVPTLQSILLTIEMYL